MQIEATPVSPKAPGGPSVKPETKDKTRAEDGIKGNTPGDVAAKDNLKADGGTTDSIKAEDAQPKVASVSPVHNKPVTRRAPHNPLPAILTSSPASAGFAKVIVSAWHLSCLSKVSKPSAVMGVNMHSQATR